jgi:hypothetical protein
LLVLFEKILAMALRTRGGRQQGRRRRRGERPGERGGDRGHGEDVMKDRFGGGNGIELGAWREESRHNLQLPVFLIVARCLRI